MPPFSPSPLKDILLLDLECSGTDPLRHGIVQVAALRLDQVGFVEHGHFCSYVRLEEHHEYDPEAGAVTKIDEGSARSAFTPDLQTVLLELQAFAPPDEVVLAAWNGAFDLGFLLENYRRLGLPWRWDFHFLELWSLAWLVFPDMTSPNLTRVSERLQLPARRQHDALEDVRQEADILRKLAELARQRLA